MRVVATEKLPAKIWADDIEAGALEQIRNLANLPFAFKHIAVMPDCHQGYGMPIGGVLATTGVIIPNAVGVDIGCGMKAMSTDIRIEEMDTETLKRIMGRIRETVPVGFSHQSAAQDEGFMPQLVIRTVVDREYDSALKQLGTLGGGNHFIEIQKDVEVGNVWVMIHSGSRNLGKQVADHYNKLAVGLNEKWCSVVPKPWELAFLPQGSEEYAAYLDEMQYCVAFARANRALTMERIIQAIEAEFPEAEFTEAPDVAHNYARLENHFGQNVMVHRKGATSAKQGQIGIIPGSQGTASYIVQGLGNPQSFESCSHGAGRRMGRKDATRRLDLAEEIAKLDSQGIVHSIRTVSDLDEAAGAYKPIEEVMEQQRDLVEVVHRLTPMGVIKG